MNTHLRILLAVGWTLTASATDLFYNFDPASGPPANLGLFLFGTNAAKCFGIASACAARQPARVVGTCEPGRLGLAVACDWTHILSMAKHRVKIAFVSLNTALGQA